MPPLAPFVLAAALAGCALPQTGRPFADIDRAAPGQWPLLVPVERILATAPAPARVTPALTRSLETRAADLRARAAVMRGGALSPEDRERLRAALARLRAAQGRAAAAT